MLTPTKDWHDNEPKRSAKGSWLLLGPERKSIVRVVYSDESGVGSEANEPLTVVAGLMLNIDSQWHPVLSSIENALRDILGKEEIATYEIRARNLYHQIKRGDEKADALVATLLGIIRANHVPVFYGAVDRAGFRFFLQEINSLTRIREAPTAEELGPSGAFRKAMEKCINLVDSFVHTAFPREQVLWIHDRGKYEDNAKEELNYIRRVGSTGAGSVLRMITEHGFLEQSNIIDTIYFGDSRESRALQLADLCCSTITRQLRGEAVAREYYELLKVQIVNEGSRPEYENAHEIWEAGQRRKREKSN